MLMRAAAQDRAVSAADVSTAADIMPGQGLYYTALTRSYRVKNCISNSYGVSNITYGLSPSPCRDCESTCVFWRMHSICLSLVLSLVPA
jgi:hypothetical protein